MNSVIDSFSGKYRFLGNFYPSVVKMDGLKYPTVEHAYQAAKTLLTSERKKIRDAFTPAEAKRLGRSVELRPCWDEIKLEVMEDLVRQKFQKVPLRTHLLETEDSFLVEGNWWGDTFWGVCRGVGENHLGKILMKVRKELRNGKKG